MVVGLVVIGSACNPSRERGAEPVATVVVNVPVATVDIEPADEPTEAGETSVVPATTEAARPATGSSFQVPFGDYFDVDPLGSEPVRGSGCGLGTAIGDELPDGLWRGYVRSFDGLWVDAATSLEFDLACVFAGDAALDAERDWRADHPGEDPVEVPDGFVVNDSDRVRNVPLDSSFVQVDAQWDDAGRCLPPAELPPSGATEVYRLLDSWLLVVDGEARWAVTSCLPR